MALTKIRGSTQILSQTVTNSEIAFPDGANPDGILLAKIEDGTLLVKSDGSVPFTAPITGVAPTLDNHLATKIYVDSVAQGLDVKDSVRVISTSNITLSGTQTVDGVALIAGDRVLVAGQTDAEDNGIYVVAVGAWTRAADANTSDEVKAGLFTFVEEGGDYADTGWVLATDNPITLGTTELNFTQFSSAGITNAGDGLIKTGNDMHVVSANSAITVNSNDIELTVADGTLTIGGGGLRLADLPNGQVLIGNGSNVATPQAVSGAISISNTGVTSLNNNVVTNTHIATGTIALTKLASAGGPGQIIVTNGSNVPTYVSMSGDATISNAGVLTLSADSVNSAEIVNGAVTLGKLLALDDAKFIVGTGSGNAQVAITGDVTVANTGVATINAATVVRVADYVVRETPTGTINGSNMVFTLASTPKDGTEQVFVNGLLMDEGGSNDYTIDADEITFTFAPVAGDKIRVTYLK